MPQRNTIEIIITAQNNASRVLNDVNQNLQTVGTAAIAGVGAAVGAATAAMSAFSVASLQEFQKFEKGMGEVFTLIPGASQEMRDQLIGDVNRLSQQFGNLPEDVIPSVYQALSAGVPPDNIFEFMSQASMAAEGGVTSLETAVDGISSVINAYGAEVLSAANASDIMFTAVRLGKTNFDQLSNSLFNVTPIASSLGVRFEDVAAGLATITAQGTPTTQATTQLRQALVELGDSGTQVAGIFEDVSGTSFTEFIANGNNVNDALALLSEYANESGVGINELFGSIEAGQAALALTGNNAERFAAALEEMNSASGATRTAFEEMAAGIDWELNRLTAKFDVLKIAIGTKLAPAFTEVLNLGGNLLSLLIDLANGTSIDDVLADFDEYDLGMLAPVGKAMVFVARQVEKVITAFDRYNTVLGLGFSRTVALKSFLRGFFPTALVENTFAFLNAIGDVFNVIRRALKPVTDFVTKTITLQDVLGALAISILTVVIPAITGVVVAASPVILTFLALTGVVAGLRIAWERDFLGIRTAIENAFLWFIDSDIASQLEETLSDIGNTLSGVGSNVSLGFSVDTNDINKRLTKLKLRIGKDLTAIRNMFSEIGQFIGTVFANVDLSGIVSIAGTILSLISPIGRVRLALQFFNIDLGQVFRDGVLWVTDFFATLNGAAENPQAMGIVTLFRRIKNVIDGFVLPSINSFVGVLSSIWTNVSEGLGSLFNWFVTDDLPQIQNTISNNIIPIIDAFINVLRRIWKFVQPGIQALINGLTGEGEGLNLIGIALDGVQIAIDAMTDAFAGIWNLISPTLESLLNWFTAEGLPQIKTAIESARPLITEIFTFLQSVWDLISPALNSIYQWFQNTGLPVIGHTIANVVTPVVSGFFDIIAGAWDYISTSLTNIFQWFNETGMPIITSGIREGYNLFVLFRTIVAALWDRLQTPLNALKTGIMNVFGTIQGIVDGVILGINNIGGAVEGAIEAIQRLAGTPMPDVSAITEAGDRGFVGAPGFANGIAYVPRDNMLARLHRGERVLTARENTEYSTNNNNNITINISGGNNESGTQRANEIVTQLRLLGVQI